MDDEKYLVEAVGQFTTEELLLAANVVSTQHPQGPGFDREKLLKEAALLVREAKMLILRYRSLFYKSERAVKVMRGYSNRFDEADCIPYDQAVMQITGLKSKKQAVERFRKFTAGHPKYKIWDVHFRRIGIAKELIPELIREENASFLLRRSCQNKENASRPRPARKKDQKSPKKDLNGVARA
jgi:hypothetical protein